MSLLDKIDQNKIPQHIAIIMDGNGRWAKQRGLERVMGHSEGLKAVRRSIEAASTIKLPYITLYTFSTENWNRPIEEVDALMSLMIKAVREETEDLVKNNVCLKVIGDFDRLPESTKKALAECLDLTSKCTGTTLLLALSYSSKWELTKAIRSIASDVKDSKIQVDDIDEALINNHLDTKGIPYPDILIRTGGEKRISNFLLWQIAYSELFFTDQLWPEFDENSLYEIIIEFQQRERRYGKISEQITNPEN